LQDLGYPTRGIHIHLGIDEFSDASEEAVRIFAEQRGLPFTTHSLKQVFGYALPEIKQRTRRKICGVCGFLKRQLLNRLTIREGYQTLALGHNLDDEAGRLLGNMVRHRSQYFEKQYPFLPSSHPRIPAKLKPLYRLEAHEIRTYCHLTGIAHLATPCPFSRGATSHTFKEALDFLEGRMPGTKRDFLFSYLEGRNVPRADADFAVCRKCGEPAYEDVCSVCNLTDRLSGKTGPDNCRSPQGGFGDQPGERLQHPDSTHSRNKSSSPQHPFRGSSPRAGSV
ncbi:MAG: hypothetical protein HGA84_07405, partial [Syntrophobacteraceae bacterium]|nr:hypothetical protein [Syntrophobacteraceae bacterium]